MIIITEKKAAYVKRWLTFFLLLLGTLRADPTVHFGLGAIGGSESFTVRNPGEPEQREDVLLQGVQFKAGYGNMRAFAIEFDLGYGRYDKNVFSDKDTEYTYFDVSLIKAFDFDIGFYPFFKLGFGTGELAVDRTITNSLSSGSFFGGIGVYVPIAYGFDFEASAIYRDKSWEGLKMIGAQVKSTSYIIEPYLGINYRF